MAEREELSTRDRGHREEETHQHENRLENLSTNQKPDIKEQSDHYGLKDEQHSADTEWLSAINPLPKLKPDLKEDDEDEEEDYYDGHTDIQDSSVDYALIPTANHSPEPKLELEGFEYIKDSSELQTDVSLESEDYHFSVTPRLSVLGLGKPFHSYTGPVGNNYGSRIAESWQPWSSLDGHTLGSKFNSRINSVQHGWSPYDNVAKPQNPYYPYESYDTSIFAPDFKYEPPKFEPPNFDLPNFEPPNFDFPKFEPPKFELPKIEPPKPYEPRMSDGSDDAVVFGYVILAVVGAAMLGVVAYVLCALLQRAVIAVCHLCANVGRARPSNMHEEESGVYSYYPTRASIASNDGAVAVPITPEQVHFINCPRLPSRVAAKDDLPPSYMTCQLEEELPPSYSSWVLNKVRGSCSSLRGSPGAHGAADAGLRPSD